MAISVNTVYQTVLYILNKEQRGYAPPDEFNSIGAQVQLEIFNSYFPDGNQVNRQNQRNTQNDTEYFNIFDNLSYRLTPFVQEITLLLNNTLAGATPIYGDGISFSYPSVDPTSGSLNPEIYLFGEVTCIYTGSPRYESVAQKTSKKEYTRIEKSNLTKPTKSFTGGSYGQYIYSSSNSNDFSLDISEQTNLVTNILKYFGIVINDPTIIQTATQEAAKVEQNEKA